MNILYFSPVQLYPKGHGNRATVHQYISRLRDTEHKVLYLLLNEENIPCGNFSKKYNEKYKKKSNIY